MLAIITASLVAERGHAIIAVQKVEESRELGARPPLVTEGLI